MSRLALASALLLALAAGPGRAETASEVARAAVAELQDAGKQLQAARGSRDRVAALTRVIHAYETGLAALREGLRQAAIQEAALRQRLDAESGQISELLGALESLETTPENLLLLHPEGPLGAVRSGMILAEVTPALQVRAQALKARLDEIRTLGTLQEAAVQTLQESMSGVQQARAELSAAISNRTDLPRRYADDGKAVAELAEATDTLAAFAEELRGLHPDVEAAGPAPKTPLPLPVEGRLLRRFGEADAAGISRPGWVVATRPRALVTAPVPATIRYLGPLLDYGNVMILEPDPDTLLVLAGLGEVYGATGQVVPAGAPLGLMGGSDDTLAAADEGAGAERSETLYLELRKGNEPVDPAVWFEGTKDGTE